MGSVSYTYFGWVTTSMEEFLGMSVSYLFNTTTSIGSIQLRPSWNPDDPTDDTRLWDFSPDIPVNPLKLHIPNVDVAGREELNGWVISGNAGGSTIYRIREGIERFLITDINNPAGSAMAQSSVPVMWDIFAAVKGGSWANPDTSAPTQFNHLPGGSNVLYMDGHVEFIKYPGKFPLIPAAAVLFSQNAFGNSQIW